MLSRTKHAALAKRALFGAVCVIAGDAIGRSRFLAGGGEFRKASVLGESISTEVRYSPLINAAVMPRSVQNRL